MWKYFLKITTKPGKAAVEPPQLEKHVKKPVAKVVPPMIDDFGAVGGEKALPDDGERKRRKLSNIALGDREDEFVNFDDDDSDYDEDDFSD